MIWKKDSQIHHRKRETRAMISMGIFGLLFLPLDAFAQNDFLVPAQPNHNPSHYVLWQQDINTDKPAQGLQDGIVEGEGEWEGEEGEWEGEEGDWEDEDGVPENKDDSDEHAKEVGEEPAKSAGDQPAPQDATSSPADPSDQTPEPTLEPEKAEQGPVDSEPPAGTVDGAGVDSAASADNADGAVKETNGATNILAEIFRVGDPIPLTRREPTVSQFTFEVDLHYGLVGSGPTRFTNDVRFGLFDWWELRTAFLPYPTSLISRFRIGSQQGLLGALLLDGGLANFDAGLRIEQGLDQNLDVGMRFHFEIGIAYAKAFGRVFSVYTMARYRYRYSQLDDEGSITLFNYSLPIPTNRFTLQAGETDEQNAASIEAHLTYDLLPMLALSGGVGYAEVIGTPVRELSVNFTETGRPGMSHFLLRNDGWSRSLTIPMAITYGLVDTFDVDVFLTPRLWPELGVLFGAGLRWRI